MSPTYVTARQTRWIPLECEQCGVRYSCQVEAHGVSDNSILPLSEDNLKEFALLNLDEDSQKQASAVPCPGCGAFPASYVERTCRIAGRVAVWVIAPLLLVAMIALICVAMPKTPVWTLFLMLIAAVVGARFLSKPIVGMFDPNRNLELNLKFAKVKVERGVVRVEAEK